MNQPPPTAIPSGPTTTPIVQPEYNPSPRARYQAGLGNLTAHKSLLEITAFDRAVDFALMQYVSDLSEQAAQAADAVSVGYRLKGAKEFISVLKTLAAQPKQTTRTPITDNLSSPDAPKRS